MEEPHEVAEETEYRPRPLRPFVPRGGSGKRAGQRDEYYLRNREKILAKRREETARTREERGAPTIEQQKQSHERRAEAARNREANLSPEVRASKLRTFDAARAIQQQRYKAERREWEAIRLRLTGSSLKEVAEKLGFGKSRKRVRTAVRSVDLPEGKRYLCDRGVPFTRGTAVAFYRSLRQSPKDFAKLISTPGHPVRGRRITIWFTSATKNLDRLEAQACIDLRKRIAAKLLGQDTRNLGFDAYSRVEVLASLFPRLRNEYQLLRATLPDLRTFVRSNGEAGEAEIAVFVIERAQREKKEKSESRRFRELVRWLPDLLPVLVAQKTRIAGDEVTNRLALAVLAHTIPATPFGIVRHAIDDQVRPTRPERMRELLRVHLPELFAAAAAKVRGVGGRKKLKPEKRRPYQMAQSVYAAESEMNRGLALLKDSRKKNPPNEAIHRKVLTDAGFNTLQIEALLPSSKAIGAAQRYVALIFKDAKHPHGIRLKTVQDACARYPKS